MSPAPCSRSVRIGAIIAVRIDGSRAADPHRLEDRMTATGRTDLAALDAPLRALFEVVAAADRPGAPDLAAIGRAMVALARDHDYLLPRIAELGTTSGMRPAPRAGARPAADARPPRRRAR